MTLSPERMFAIVNVEDVDGQPRTAWLKLKLNPDGTTYSISVQDELGEACSAGVVAELVKLEGQFPATLGLAGGLKVEKVGANYRNISAASTTTVKSGAGTLVAVLNNNAKSSTTITVYDNTTNSGTKIATIANPITLINNQYAMLYGCVFSTGLTVVTSGADDITVIYR